jgi:alpha-tubulin suppressor-like RCC1 family protein
MGASSASATTAHGSVAYGWGYVGTGSFGRTAYPSKEDSPVPVSLPGDLSIVDLSSSGIVTLAIGSDGNVYAWGDNTAGQLGDGSTTTSATPVKVSLPTGVTAVTVASGAAESYAVGSDHKVYAWGDNTDGQLGQGYLGAPPNSPNNTPTYVTTPEVVPALSSDEIVSVSTLEGTTMALSNAGVVYAWGEGGDGQMGDGTNNGSSTPIEVPVLDSSTDQPVVSIAVGQGYCAVATQAGAVYTWGSDSQGQLGNHNGAWTFYPGLPDVLTPTKITLPAGVGDAVEVAAGSYNGVALTKTGQIVGWGEEFYGDLGTGLAPTSALWVSTPQLTLAPSDGGAYTQVTMDSDSVTALDSKGAVWSWGANDDGQMGDGTDSSTIVYSPTKTTVATGVTPWAVVAGGTSAYMLTDGAPPAFTSASSTAFSAGSSSTFTVTTSGAPAAALSETGALPTSVTFKDDGNGTATISGKPAAGTGGAYAITLHASNTFDASVTQSFTLTVSAHPSFSSPASAYLAEGASGSFQVVADGYPVPTVSLATGAKLPAGLALTAHAGGTATISGTPTAPIGSYVVTLKATNGRATVTQTLTIHLQRPPTFTSTPAATFTVGTRGSFTVTTGGAPVARVTTTSVLPQGLKLVDGTGGIAVLSGTPAVGTGGSYTLDLSAANPLVVKQALVLTIRERPSLLTALPLTMTLGQTNTDFIHFSSGYPGKVTIVVKMPLPAGLSFDDLGAGTAEITGQPGGAPRTVTLSVVATNGAGPTTVSVSINIENGRSAPS